MFVSRQFSQNKSQEELHLPVVFTTLDTRNNSNSYNALHASRKLTHRLNELELLPLLDLLQSGVEQCSVVSVEEYLYQADVLQRGPGEVSLLHLQRGVRLDTAQYRSAAGAAEPTGTPSLLLLILSRLVFGQQQ